jgi:hypothetical protein
MYAMAQAEEKGLVMELPFEIPDLDPPAKKIKVVRKAKMK